MTIGIETNIINYTSHLQTVECDVGVPVDAGVVESARLVFPFGVLSVLSHAEQGYVNRSGSVIGRSKQYLKYINAKYMQCTIVMIHLIG